MTDTEKLASAFRFQLFLNIYPLFGTKLYTATAYASLSSLCFTFSICTMYLYNEYKSTIFQDETSSTSSDKYEKDVNILNRDVVLMTVVKMPFVNFNNNFVLVNTKKIQ
jgi:hypothetical protein